MRQIRHGSILALIATLSFAPPAFAQGCAGVMTPEYSTYASYALDSGGHIYSTVVLDGSTQIGNTEYCNLSGVTHTPQIRNALGSSSGTVQGSPVSPSAYISISNTQEILAMPGTNYDEAFAADVYCSAVGTLFSSTGGTIWVRLAVTNYVYSGVEELGTPPQNCCGYSKDCPNGSGAASCGVDFLLYPDQGTCLPYAYTWQLVVNGDCFSVGIESMSNTARNCT